MATSSSRADARAPRRDTIPPPLADVDVVILAGGLGTRLRTVLPDRQKVMADAAGRPFLANLIDFYVAAGAKRIVLALGHRAGDVEVFARQFKTKAELVTSVEPEARGTAGALRHALPLLRTGTVLVANGDSFADVDLNALRRLHQDRQSAITLALALVGNVSRYGLVIVDRHGAVTHFDEKPATESSSPGTPGHINAGIYFLETDVIAEIPAGIPISLEREVFARYVGRGLHAMAISTSFIDIGTPESWASVDSFFATLAKRKGLS
jgi:NDP-sugar pyrophosphorylase family protein